MDWTTWILIIILIALIPFAFIDILNHIQNFVIWRQKKSLDALKFDMENIDELIDRIYSHSNEFKDKLKKYKFENLNEDIKELKKSKKMLKSLINNIESNIRIVQTIQTDQDGMKSIESLTQILENKIKSLKELEELIDGFINALEKAKP